MGSLFSMQTIRAGIADFFQFRYGRINRAQFFVNFVLIGSIASWLGNELAKTLTGSKDAGTFAGQMIATVFLLIMGAKRTRDIGYPGLWFIYAVAILMIIGATTQPFSQVLFGITTLVFLALLLAMLLWPGRTVANRFGPVPKAWLARKTTN